MKNDRHATTETSCEWCGKVFIARTERVEQGLGRFCSRDHYNEWQRKNKQRDNVGKENGKIYKDKRKGGYYVQWVDTVSGKVTSSTYSKWAWEVNFGEIPEGHAVEYIDGNKENAIPENLQLRLTKRGRQALPRAERILSAEHRQKIAIGLQRAWKSGKFDFHKTGRKSRKVTSPKNRSEVMRQLHKNHPEIRKQVSEKLMGREFTEEHIKNLSIAGKKRKDIRGKNSRFWRGGVYQNEYPEEFNRYLKQEIRSRDGNVCQSCDENLYRSKRGHVHHINGNKQDCDKSNLILLCATCHNAVHGRNTITSEIIEFLKTKLDSTGRITLE